MPLNPYCQQFSGLANPAAANFSHFYSEPVLNINFNINQQLFECSAPAFPNLTSNAMVQTGGGGGAGGGGTAGLDYAAVGMYGAGGGGQGTLYSSG